MSSTGASLKRGKSEQVVATPWAFIRAVEARFGKIAVDLAADDDNAKAERYITPTMNTFEHDWNWWLKGRLGWINPEYDPLGKWMRLCKEQRHRGAEFVALTPASVSTNWYWDHVHGYATVYCLTPRIAFVGSHVLWPKDHPQAGQRKCDDPDCEGCSPYPKDLMLSHYCVNPSRELRRWKWR